MTDTCGCRKLNGFEYFFFVFLKDVNFTNFYNNTPEVFVSAEHSSKGGHLSPAYNDIAAWVEVG